MERVQMRRAVAAALVVMAIIGGVAASGFLERGTSAMQGPVRGAGGRPAEAGIVSVAALLQAGGVDAALEMLEESAEAGGSLPPSFQAEIGLPGGYRDLRGDGAGGVVGFVMDGSPRDALGLVAAELGARGWTEVPLGSFEGATYVKRSGVYRWALVSGVAVGDVTSVVVRTDAP